MSDFYEHLKLVTHARYLARVPGIPEAIPRSVPTCGHCWVGSVSWHTHGYSHRSTHEYSQVCITHAQSYPFVTGHITFWSLWHNISGAFGAKILPKMEILKRIWSCHATGWQLKRCSSLHGGHRSQAMKSWSKWYSTKAKFIYFCYISLVGNQRIVTHGLSRLHNLPTSI